MSVNKVIVIGNLGANPNIRSLPPIGVQLAKVHSRLFTGEIFPNESEHEHAASIGELE